jgi:hypothetical protein
LGVGDGPAALLVDVDDEEGGCAPARPPEGAAEGAWAVEGLGEAFEVEGWGCGMGWEIEIGAFLESEVWDFALDGCEKGVSDGASVVEGERVGVVGGIVAAFFEIALGFDLEFAHSGFEVLDIGHFDEFF